MKSEIPLTPSGASGVRHGLLEAVVGEMGTHAPRACLHVCMAATPSLGTAEDSDDIARNDRRLSRASFDLNLEHHERDTVEK